MRFSGEVRGAIDALDADVLVLAGVGEQGRVAGMIEAGHGGVEIEVQPAYDATRSLAVVKLDDVRAVVPERVRDGRDLQRALIAAVFAGRAWEHDRAEFALAANAVRVVAADAIDYCAPENGFIHGGVGATWEHDAQLYYRRGELSRRLACGAAAAADDVGQAPFDEL